MIFDVMMPRLGYNNLIWSVSFLSLHLSDEKHAEIVDASISIITRCLFNFSEVCMWYLVFMSVCVYGTSI